MDSESTRAINFKKPVFILAVLIMLLSVVVLLLWYTGNLPSFKTDEPAGIDKVVNKPVRMYPDSPVESVRAQSLAQVDFSNPHTVKNVPRMIPTMKSIEKLVVIRKLRELGTPEAVEALKWIVENDKSKAEERVIGQAAGSLVSIDSDASWKTLNDLSGSSDSEVREAIATSLGYTNSPTALEILNRLDSDASESVKSAARQAIEKRSDRGKGN